ncbi:hypothetical protein [Anaerotruncus rubiinfantis]|uniref:hypothetical protein n=1 Tax=Anaerotruncus rubiinfantis TaxID=1720200 RepID=UPI0034A4A52E
MDNNELLVQIAQIMEQQTQSLRAEMVSMETRLNDRIDNQTKEIKEAIVRNNVEIGEVFEQALEPVSHSIHDIQEDITLLRADNAKNTLDIARLKIAK